MNQIFQPLCVLAVALLVGSPATAAERIVVADGPATEIAYLLGEQDRIVGVDSTSQFPEDAKALPQVGYFRRLAAEGILSLRPDMIITSPYAGPPVVLEQLRSAGVEVLTLPDATRLEELIPKIKSVGSAFGAEDAAVDLVERYGDELSAIRADRPDWESPPRVLFVLTIRDSAPLAAGKGTVCDEVIREAGAINVAEFEGYKPMSREAVIAASPDMVLMTNEHSDAINGVETVLSRPEFSLTPAGKTGAYLTLPALAVLGLGPRTPQAVQELREALAP